MKDERTPQVFISYSHDSKEHKQWVLELAQRLVGDGVQVIIDQWDLEFGDDVPKFMERWVTNSERVLMICTEAYVRKVDEGKGGAGYEAMVVTQELIRDLGTKKFIPVIRQPSEPVFLPKCIGTRMGVNLSVYADADGEFEKLVTQLRQQPPLTKPPLGQSSVSPMQLLPAVKAPASFARDPSSAYDEALAIARSTDLVSWRRLVMAERKETAEALARWRDEVKDRLPGYKKDLPDFLRGALIAYQPLFAVTLAAIESGQPKFSRQGSLIYDLMEPSGWERSGSTFLVGIPDAAAWIFQALAGAMYVHTAQIALAVDMATQRVQERYGSRSSPLYLNHCLTGWPDALETSCTTAWQFLWGLPEQFPWLSKAFGTSEQFKSCLCGYYLMLSWLEFIELLRGGNVASLNERELRLDVPPFFIRHKESERGLRLVLEDRSAFQEYARAIGVAPETQIEHWPKWTAALGRWIQWVLKDHFYDLRPQSGFDHMVVDMHR